MRHTIRPFIKFHIGDGRLCSTWYDVWDKQGPIKSFVSGRDISKWSGVRWMDQKASFRLT